MPVTAKFGVEIKRSPLEYRRPVYADPEMAAWQALTHQNFCTMCNHWFLPELPLYTLCNRCYNEWLPRLHLPVD